MLVGREDECAILQSVLAESAVGRPRVVVLRGDPGIGKTRLLEYASEAAKDFRVVRVQGHEAERDIPFAGLSMLVRPLDPEFPELPGVQAAALKGALNLGPAVHGDRLGVAAATLALLAAAADRGPVMLAVDDVHLLDVPTLEALFFALRRIRTERIAVVITARPESEVTAIVERWLQPMNQIQIQGLDLDASRLLMAHRGPLQKAVFMAAAGNPLALLEMTPADMASVLAEPLQLSARMLQAYGRRLTGLDGRTREALLQLAIAGHAGDMLDAALAHRGLERADLDAAEAAGLIIAGSGATRFAHPLVCSAAYHSGSPAQKRAAHQAMVAACSGRTAPGAAERWAFHLAAATAGPDESVAGRLAAAAKDAAARHSHTTAAALYERAAWLSPSGAARTRRIIEAAMAGQAAGTLDAAGPLLELAIAETDDDDLRTVAMHLQCRIQMWSGQPVVARDQLLQLADRTEAGHPEWSALMRSQAATVSIALGEQRSAAEMAGRAVEVTTHLPDEHALPVLVAAAVTHGINGDVDEARAFLLRCAAHLPQSDPLSIDQLLVLAALAYACIEETATARMWLETAVRKTRGAQAAGLLPFQLSWLSLLCWHDGDWVAARAHGLAAVQIAEETGWATELPNCLIALATVEATLGLEAEARAHADRAARIGAEQVSVQQAGAGIYAAHCARVLGLLHLGAGRPDDAAAQLTIAGEFAQSYQMGDTVLFSWAGNLVEALARTGRPDKAQPAFAIANDEAERTRRPTALAVAARCRGLLSTSLGKGRAAFEEALHQHAAAHEPFERARSQLCYGEFLRRHQFRKEARVQLTEALATFTLLGAAHWVHRAETELQASGLTARKRRPSPTEQLTAQELQVALVVADGVTNVEAAARLFLSAKTIEFHLSNIYRKLGIRSRSELVRKVLGGLVDEQAGLSEISLTGGVPRPAARA